MPGTPSDKICSQDFVMIKSEDQKGSATNHSDAPNSVSDISAPQTPKSSRNVGSDVKLGSNVCGNRGANGNNATVKCGDNMTMQCAPNGPLNGMCANESPMDMLADGMSFDHSCLIDVVWSM